MWRSAEIQSMNIQDELAEKVRASGVRVDARLRLLAELGASDRGHRQIADRIAELAVRIREASDRLREDLA